MAAVGIVRIRSLAEAIPAMTQIDRSFEPDPQMMRRYDAMYDAYMRTIPALRPMGVIRKIETQSELVRQRIVRRLAVSAARAKLITTWIGSA